MLEHDRREFLVRSAGGLAAMALLPELGLARMPSPRADLRVGVVGVGRHGRDVLAEIAKIEGATITAIADTDERRLASGLRRTSGAEGFADVGSLISAGLTDAIVIATPTHTHREVAEEAFASGQHVYVEAPLAATLTDCKAIAASARSATGVIAAGLQGRANPVYQLARTFFRSDSVRDLVAMRGQRHQKTSWRTPASDPARERALNWVLDPEVSLGLAGEWGTHQFDVFNWYVGRYPVKVRGNGSIRLHKDGREIADTIACTLTLDDGAELQYSATLANSYEGMYEVLYGTNAAIKLGWSHGWMFKEADAPTQGWEVYANRQQFHKDEGITLIAGATKLAEQGKLKQGIGLPFSSLYYALGDWLAAASEGSEAACSCDEAARATAVGIAANRAVVTGEEISVEM